MLVLSYALSAASLCSSGPVSRRDVGLLAGAGLGALYSPSQAAAASYTTQPGIKLNTGTNFPTASFGLQIYDDATAERLTLLALEQGYRNFFASVLARNQKGFARAVKKSGIPREELFICGSVLSNNVQGFGAAKQLSARGCRENLEAFAAGGIDYVDMIMLDYPGPDDESIRGQWAALEEMKRDGTTKTLAVSNFSPAQLDALISIKDATVPTVNQLPYGVGFGSYYRQRGTSSADVVAANSERGIVVQAWSPLQRALRGNAKEACAAIGTKYGKSPAQVALRWIAETGVTFTTAATRKVDGASARFKENADIFDFRLTKEELATLATL